MKFISKSSNLMIVLRPGMSAQPLTGTPAVATVSVRFKDGVADVQNEKLIEMMLAHPGFNSDFISADAIGVDPYAASRQASEPAHILTELKHGTPMSRTIKGGATPQLPPEIQKMVQGLAVDYAKQMLPSMLKSLVEAHEADKGPETVKTKKKPGRKAKAKVQAKTVSIAESTLPEDSQSIENPAIQEQAA